MEKVITILGDMLEGIDLLFKDVLVFFGFASAEPSSPVDPSLSPASAELKDLIAAPVPANVAEIHPPLPVPIALVQMPVLTTNQGGLVSVMDLADSRPEVFSLAQSKGASITLGEAPEFGMNNISIPPSIPHIIFVSGAGDYAATISPDFTIRGNDPGASGRTVYLFDSVDNSEFILIGRGVVDASGQWAIDLSDLNNTLHMFRASFFEDGSSPSDPFFLSVDSSPVVAGIQDTGIVDDHITKLEPGSTISGTSSVNATVIELSLNGIVVGQVSPVKGVWSLSLPSDFHDGTLQVIEKDAFGYAQNSQSFVIDNTVPSAPDITHFDAGLQILSGTGEAGSTVQLDENNSSLPLSPILVDASGRWSVSTSGFDPGVFKATQVDVAGNSSVKSNPFDNTNPPAVPSAIEVERVGSQDVVTGAGVPGGTIQLYVGGDLFPGSIRVDGSGHWKVTLSNLQEGTALYATQTNSLGTITSGAINFDNTPPDISVNPDTGFSNTDNITQLSPDGFGGYSAIKMTVPNDVYNMKVFLGDETISGTVTPGPTRFYIFNQSTPEGYHHIKIAEINTSSVTNSRAFNVVFDNTVPAAPVISSVVVDSPTHLIIEGRAEAGSLIHLLENGGESDMIPSVIITDSNGFWRAESTNFGSGQIKFSAMQEDLAGNISPASPDFYRHTINEQSIEAPKITLMSYMDSSGLAFIEEDFLKIQNQITHDLPKIQGLKTLSNPACNVILDVDNGAHVFTGAPNPDGTLTFLLNPNWFAGGAHTVKIYSRDNESGLNSAFVMLDTDSALSVAPLITGIEDAVGGITVHGIGAPSSTIHISDSHSHTADPIVNSFGAWSAIISLSTTGTHGTGVYDLIADGTPGFIMGDDANNTITILAADIAPNTSFQKIDGGAGNDTLVLGSGLTTLDFSQFKPSQTITGVEAMTMKSGDHVALNLWDILDMNSGSTHQLLFSSNKAAGDPLAIVDLHTNGAAYSTSIVNNVVTYDFTFNSQHVLASFHADEVAVNLLTSSVV